MRIAMIGHKRIPSREGGVEVVVEELAVRMVSMRHEVTCFNRSGAHVSGKQHGAKPMKSFRGVKIRHVPTIDIKGVAAVTASFFATVCAAFGRYDVVHFHSEGPCLTLWLAKLMGKRCVVTIHGLDHQRAKWGRLARMCILMGERSAAALADEIIVLSGAAQTYFRESYNRFTHLIPNGMPDMESCGAERIAKAYGLKKDGYILYLGRITPEKGLDSLIDAYRRINTDKKLVIAGGASDSHRYFQALREKAADLPGVIFTGFVKGQTLNALYSNAYLYVLPSEVEGMSMSLLEAMRCGCCCLVSDIPENVGVAGECGVVFRRGDAFDLAQKLQTLADCPQRVLACREAAAKTTKRMMGWDEVARLTLEVYQGKKADQRGGKA